MKRRSFLKNLAATAVLPAVPFKSLAAAAPTAAAATMDQPYLWASFVSRVHNKASPAMLQRLLKLEEGVAQRVFQDLVKNNVVSTPNAYGISHAINPYPQPGLSSIKPKPISSEAGKMPKSELKIEQKEELSEDVDDSPSVNQELSASQDEPFVNESPASDRTEEDRTDPNRQA